MCITLCVALSDKLGSESSRRCHDPCVPLHAHIACTEAFARCVALGGHARKYVERQSLTRSVQSVSSNRQVAVKSERGRLFDSVSFCANFFCVMNLL